jgi:uncharacterized protein
VSVSSSPDYERLVKFLFAPFTSQPDAISVNCELKSDRSRVWIRVALAEADTVNAIGRNGRNLHAIKIVLDVAASVTGQSVYLDLFGAPSARTERREDGGGDRPPRSNSGGGRRPPYGGGRGGGRRGGDRPERPR